MVIDDSYKHLVKEKKNQILCHPYMVKFSYLSL